MILCMTERTFNFIVNNAGLPCIRSGIIDSVAWVPSIYLYSNIRIHNDR